MERVVEAHSERRPSRATKLRRIARIHRISRRFHIAQAEFATRNVAELALLPYDPMACVVCTSTRGSTFRFGTDPDCACVAHKECLRASRGEEGPGVRLACRTCVLRFAELEGRPAPPLCYEVESSSALGSETASASGQRRKRPRTTVVCGTPMGGSFCSLDRGHLGHCCERGAPQII